MFCPCLIPQLSFAAPAINVYPWSAVKHLSTIWDPAFSWVTALGMGKAMRIIAVTRVWVVALLLSLASTVSFASPSRCSVGYADSTCVSRINSPYQVAPTCSNTAGWVTVTPAVWAGSHFTSPVCSYTPPPTCSTDPGWVTSAAATWNGSIWNAPVCTYVAQPTCPSGQTTITAASWTGNGWTSPTCQPIAANYPTQCASALAAGTFRVDPAGSGYWTTAPGSAFTPYTAIQQYSTATPSQVWQFSEYNISDAFVYIDIENQTTPSLMNLGLSAKDTNTWYAGTFTGPGYDATAGGVIHGYIGWCSFNSSGNLVGVTMTEYQPEVYDAN